jgi:hypothetical protein
MVLYAIKFLITDNTTVMACEVQYSSRAKGMSYLLNLTLVTSNSNFAITINDTNATTSISKLAHDYGIPRTECCLTQHKS